ncbi:MAG TPA: arsenate reductase ArsC [Polyangiaceae bacterium]|jgi:arsenate reductase
MMRILVLCTGNSARSQIAEGLFRTLGAGRVEVFSAGTKPRDAVHPMAVKVMAEHGIDISTQRPKDVEQFVGERFDYVITVCDRAKESCPVMPGAEMIHWTFADPADEPPEKQERAFRDVVTGLRARIDLFLERNKT